MLADSSVGDYGADYLPGDSSRVRGVKDVVEGD